MTIYQERPAFVVFGLDRFTTIPTTAIDVDQVPVELRQGSQPWLVQADLPEDPKVREDLMFAVLSGAPDVEYHPELYRPYAPDLLDLRKRSIDLPAFTARDADAKVAVDHFLAKKGGQLADYLYLPLKGKRKDIVMALSARDGRPVGYIAISPWREDYR